MRVLLDHSVPHGLRSHFPDEQEAVTADYKGWAHYDDDELLPHAELEFDVLVTLDTSLRYQQNVGSYEIGLVVIDVHPIILPSLKAHMGTVNDALPVAAEAYRTVVVSKDGINIPSL